MHSLVFSGLVPDTPFFYPVGGGLLPAVALFFYMNKDGMVDLFYCRFFKKNYQK
jgi:hypothetical protein